jgi:hypothetical protein
MDRRGSISFVMALRQPEFVAQFSTVVWTVYNEVRKFCFWRVLQDFKRLPSKADLILNLSFRRVVPGETTDILDYLDEEQPLTAVPEFWNRTLRRTSGTIHHSATARMIRHMLPVDKRYDRLVIIMDGQFTVKPSAPALWLSPAKPRQDYIVLSLLPLDPQYGSDLLSTPGIMTRARRQLIVKQRLRAACLSMIGPTLGLKNCTWDDCFMYVAVKSVRQLDRMRKLGSEHAPELATRDAGEVSFSESGDPSRIEEIVYAYRERKELSA